MPGRIPPEEKFQEALDAYHKFKRNYTHAAQYLGIPRPTLQDRCNRAIQLGLSPVSDAIDPEKKRMSDLQRDLYNMRNHIKDLESKVYDTEKIKEIIHDCKVSDRHVPKWMMPKNVVHVNTGIPLIFLSDWHWDEVIFPEQVNYVNAFNRKIAIRRAELCFKKCVELLIHHMEKPNYPRIVVAFGGDMLSGNIHEELRETNEAPISKSIVNVHEHLVAGLNLLVEHFKFVEVHAVPGNHGRWDRKPRFKNRVYENFEWILYQFLAREFRGDDRFYFDVSDSPDCLFKIYNTTYLLSHGDQAKGGEGVSGAFSPIVRMDLKKRQRQMAINQAYDYLMVGHWHQHITPSIGTIVNGTLKGFDEYALEKNFAFQIPQQAMWATHPDYGITFKWPIYLEKQGEKFTKLP